MHWVLSADRLTAAPGEGEDGACSSISAHSSFLLFPSHPECWCLDSWSSEQLESGTARLPWAFLKQQQPVPGWLWPSQGTGWPSSPQTSHLHCQGQCLSSSPLAQPCSSGTQQAAVRHGRGAPGTGQAQLDPLCLFHVGMACL